MTISPSLPYSGICFVHSAPNRFEAECGKLHVSYPGTELADAVAACGIPYSSTAAMTLDEPMPPPGTKKLVLFGEPAMKLWMGENNLNAHRGWVKQIASMEAVATYAPIDFSDVRDYEEDEPDEDPDAGGTGKDASPTMRSNYRFWARADIRKLICNERRTEPRAQYVYLTVEEAIRILPALSGNIFFDIETHPPTDTVQCFAIADDLSPVYMIGTYDWTGRACGNLARLFAVVARLMAVHRFVIHNAMFDLPFLAHYHGVPFGRKVADTMLQQHRCFPEVEKSLAHCISYWINAPYHKDESGCYTPFNRAQFNQLLAYCGKDVATTREIFRAQRRHIITSDGLVNSTEQANAAIYNNALTCLTGLKLDTATHRAHISRLEKETDFLTKVLHVLTGLDDFNPASPAQVGHYFHTLMNYPILDRTDTGAPATGGEIMYRLKNNHPDNPVVDVMLKFKERSKQLSSLGFEKYYRPSFR